MDISTHTHKLTPPSQHPHTKSSSYSPSPISSCSPHFPLNLSFTPHHPTTLFFFRISQQTPMGFDDLCNTGLDLGLGFKSTTIDNRSQNKSAASVFEPSLTLRLCGDMYNQDCTDTGKVLYRQNSSASSLSNGSAKREREIGSEEVEIERLSSRIISDEDDDGSNVRKKLRLDKDQSALLEESFKLHSTLNPKQKQELARKLTLRPRQVEVWFQNRRARTKLKQTEVDCEFLKNCCETLTEENRSLQKELQALKLSQPLYMHLPAATLTMCPSCQRIGGSSAGGDYSSKRPLSMARKPHFFNPFPHPSAAC